MATIEKRLPSIIAISIEARPGPITGIVSSERSAAMPESLIVSMQTAW